MLKLDLTFKGKLDSEIKVLSNKIVNQSRTPFTQIVSKLSEPMKGSINWWVEGPSSRNPITSPFFHYYCAFSLVDELIEQGYTISEIVVDSFAFKKILKQYFQLKRKPIIIKYKDNTLLFYFKQLIIPFFKIFRTIYYNMYKYIYV